MSARAIDTSATVRAIIVAHPFFNDLDLHHVHLLAECASFERFGPGEDIFREGQQADRFYLIHRGRVSLETFVPRTGTTSVQTVEAGGALGWSWVYPPYQWRFSARALDPVEAVTFEAIHLREKAAENHDFGYDLLLRMGRVMLDTLQGMRRKLVEFYVRDLVE